MRLITMPRQNLERLQAMCKEAGKIIPKEWPEGLIGVGPDMRAFVRSQEEAPKPAPKPKAKKPAKKDE